MKRLAAISTLALALSACGTADGTVRYHANGDGGAIAHVGSMRAAKRACPRIPRRFEYVRFIVRGSHGRDYLCIIAR